MKPVWDIVGETVDRTARAWKTLAQKELLPWNIRGIIDNHIQSVVHNTGKNLKG
jgi:hypothetical protein